MIRGARYLRNARHLNKLLFTFSNELFYEPFDSRYQPSNEYIDLVTDLSKSSSNHWTITRDGLWMHVHPSSPPQSADQHPKPLSLPVQGWKVHVSATLSNGGSILSRAARIALANDVPFKFALDRNILSLMSSKAWPRSRSGKFITMYPSDLPAFKGLLEVLYLDLRSHEGPYILSDKRYKDCRVLYYRYGGMERTTRLEITGERTLVFISPDGATIPDVRTPYFAPPPWVTDPFPSRASPDREVTLNAGRYVAKQALAFSNSGGVYLAEDRDTGTNVVIKEARAHTLMDAPGNDATRILEKEQAICLIPMSR